MNARLVFGTTLAFLLLLTSKEAPTVRRNAIVCDLYVNDLRVTWPTSSMFLKECLSVRDGLAKGDKTKADIICKCQVGDRI